MRVIKTEANQPVRFIKFGSDFRTGTATPDLDASTLRSPIGNFPRMMKTRYHTMTA